MSKLMQLSEDNVKFIWNIIYELGLDHQVNLEIIGMKQSKTLFNVSKTNATAEYLSKKPESVCIYVYEDAFDRLDDVTKDILVRDMLMGVKYDFDKDKITIGCPTIVVSVEGRAKWGDKLINSAELAVHTIQQIEEEKREQKEREKAEKAAKKGKKGF